MSEETESRQKLCIIFLFMHMTYSFFPHYKCVLFQEYVFVRSTLSSSSLLIAFASRVFFYCV